MPVFPSIASSGTIRVVFLFGEQGTPCGLFRREKALISHGNLEGLSVWAEEYAWSEIYEKGIFAT
jgi:hypothetical protein